MADTTRGWWPDKICTDCGEKGVIFQHWGHLAPKGEVIEVCGPCMKIRDDKFRGIENKDENTP